VSRTIRDNRIDTKAARLRFLQNWEKDEQNAKKLPPPAFCLIERDCHLGYVKRRSGAVWIFRRYLATRSMNSGAWASPTTPRTLMASRSSISTKP
jgi:hypothetical protein